MKEVTVNRTYKDSVFRMIFREKAELLSLYNALNHSHYDNPEDIITYTIEDAIYIGLKNDVGFLIDNYLNLYEAQSTWNPNMPLRGLFYFSTMYNQYLTVHEYDIHAKKLLPIPTPCYIVLYNGTKDVPDQSVMRLSDSFIHPTKSEPALECTATILNINHGRNPDLMSACRKLYEYSYLIQEIRIGLQSGLLLKAAVENAVEHCIQNGILVDLLKKERAKVVSKFLTEYADQFHVTSEKRISYREGEENTKKKIILNMLKANMDDATICQLTECDSELIALIRAEMTSADE